MTTAVKQNKQETSSLKLNDALPETVITTHNWGKFGLFHKWQSK